MTGKKNRSGKVPLKYYVAAALLANAPALMLNAFISRDFLVENLLIGALITYSVSMAGGAWAGYLLSRKTNLGYRRVGLPTGLFSYIIYAIFLTISGTRGSLLVDFPSLLGFTIGGAAGARYWEIKNNQISDSRS